MTFTIVVSAEAQSVLDDLQVNDTRKYEKVLKTLALMQANIRHPGLHTHEYSSRQGPNGEKAFEAYVENRTPAAYRVFWYYGPGQGVISIITITPHP